MNLTLKHTAQTVRNNTFYIFEVWHLELAQEIYNEIKLHPNVFISTTLQEPELSDHCRFLTFNSTSVAPVDQEEVRISFACLCHITFKGKSIFFFKDNKAKPFGGALWFKKDCKFIKKHAFDFDDESSLDLRFFVKGKHLPKVIKWFNKKTGRELNPLRELKEELTIENLILSKYSWKKLEDTFLNQGLKVFSK